MNAPRRRLLIRLLPVLGVLAALAAAVVVGGLFMWGLGYTPARTMQLAGEVVRDAWATGRGTVLATTGKLVCTGLAVGFAFRCGLFNIGAEGQLLVAGFLTAVVGLAVAGAPIFLALPLLVGVGVLGGALWGAIPGFLRAFSGAHEVITTIMLNIIAVAGLKYFFQPGSSIIVPGTITTKSLDPAHRFPMLSDWMPGIFGGSLANAALFVILAALVLYGWYLARTGGGMSFRALGHNPSAAEAAGVNVRWRIVAAMTISGAFAALAGIEEVLGARGNFGEDVSQGHGFTGIAVALLGRNSPLGILLAAGFFALLDYGKITLGMNNVPREIVTILQALIIMAVICSSFVVLRVRLWLLRRLTAEEEGAPLQESRN